MVPMWNPSQPKPDILRVLERYTNTNHSLQGKDDGRGAVYLNGARDWTGVGSQFLSRAEPRQKVGRPRGRAEVHCDPTRDRNGRPQMHIHSSEISGQTPTPPFVRTDIAHAGLARVWQFNCRKDGIGGLCLARRKGAKEHWHNGLIPNTHEQGMTR